MWQMQPFILEWKFMDMTHMFLLIRHGRLSQQYSSRENQQMKLYKECDYITVHVPALEDTKGMINKDAISLMKKGVVILNFARDVLVNQEDIVDALSIGESALLRDGLPDKRDSRCQRRDRDSASWVHLQRSRKITVLKWLRQR